MKKTYTYRTFTSDKRRIAFLDKEIAKFDSNIEKCDLNDPMGKACYEAYRNMRQIAISDRQSTTAKIGKAK